MTEWPPEFLRDERLASVGQVGGFRPPSTPRTSWLGQVLLGLPGETWPESELLWRAHVDMPSHDDAPDAAYSEFFSERDEWPEAAAYGLEVGGWPATVQSEVIWALAGDDPVEFVIQVDTDEKSHVMIGDTGLACFGWSASRGWLMEWQSH